MGILGKVLEVDLSARRLSVDTLEVRVAQRVLGGRGLNAWQLCQGVAAEADPLGEDSLLLLSCGLLTGTAVPASSRLHLGGRSPLTGLLGSSNIGGHVGAALRAAGVQSVRIRGRAEAPVYLWIDGERVEIGDASDLWGLETRAAAHALQERLGAPDARVLAIGPGGESGVRYACIMSASGHAAGRTGLGAVMGAKRLKAIAIRGAGPAPRADAHTKALLRAYAERIRRSPRYETYARYSNSAYLTWADELGILPTHNFRQGRFAGAGKVDGKELLPYVRRAKSCHRCPVHCKAEVCIESGRFAGLVGERPDIEPIMALGPRCGVDDPEAVLYLHNLAGALGIDVISTGGVLAFAMELYERGILRAEDTGGLELRWGDAGAMERTMRAIARREGLGAILAEGVRRAAQAIGHGAAAYAYHAKGLEFPGYDPRGALGTALGYAVSSRGADFTSVYATPEFRWTPEQGREAFGSEKAVDRLAPEGKGALVARATSVSAVLDSLGICKVPVLSVVGDFSLAPEAALAAALTGWEMDAAQLLEAGRQIVSLERRFNLRCGLTVGDDALPAHFARDPASGGPAGGLTVDVGPMLHDYYRAMGWDEQGRPGDLPA